MHGFIFLSLWMSPIDALQEMDLRSSPFIWINIAHWVHEPKRFSCSLVCLPIGHLLHLVCTVSHLCPLVHRPTIWRTSTHKKRLSDFCYFLNMKQNSNDNINRHFLELYSINCYRCLLILILLAFYYLKCQNSFIHGWHTLKTKGETKQYKSKYLSIFVFLLHALC